MSKQSKSPPLKSSPHVMILEADYYEAITHSLVSGAVGVLDEAGASYELFPVPGAFELPTALKYAIRSMDFGRGQRRFDAYIALGCVIRGETSHYDYVCGECARGLQDLSMRYSLALGFGVLTVENRDQAIARSTGPRNKGIEAAQACLRMLEIKEHFQMFPRVG